MDPKHELLTPNISFLYTKFKLTSTGGNPEKLGYLTFEAKSNVDDQYYEIRAFNSNSVHARTNKNRAITLFVQEAMRSYSQAPESFVLNSLEFNDDKICYALISRNTPLLDQTNPLTIPKFDFFKLLRGILEEIKHLSLNGSQRIQIPAFRVYRIDDRYFLQDWNQILPLEFSDDKKAEAAIYNIEEDNIYELGLVVLDLHRAKSDEIRVLRSTSFYDKILEPMIFENKSFDINLTKEQKKLLFRMLDKDPKNRPKVTDLIKENGVSLSQPRTQAYFLNKLEESKNKYDTYNQDKQPSQDKKQPNSTPSISQSNGSKLAELQNELKKFKNPLEITEINVSGNNIGPEGAIYLSENNSWKNLKTLNLRENLIRDQGAAALGKNNSWPNLKSLELWGNAITAEGINSLSNNDSWINLKSLSLRENKIGPEGAKILSKNSSWIKLTTLNLQENSIGAEGAIALTKNSTWKKLKMLDLGNNSIGAEGAAALSKNCTWTKLTTLHLQENAISAQGAIELSKNTVWIELKELDLMDNKIGEEGLKGLYSNKSWKNLKMLKLQGNPINAETQKRFMQNKPSIKLLI